jgi:predicted metal-dependent phosphoesterase TrpH
MTAPYFLHDTVYIGKPNFLKLIGDGYNLFDMHVHTTVSDGADTVKNVLKAARKNKIGISITDHNKIKGSIRAHNNNYDVPIIPGIEITALEGRHFLAYFNHINDLIEFFNKEMKVGVKRLSEEVLIELKSKYNYIFVVAHPNGYFPWHNFKLDFNINKSDALESVNSQSTLRQIITSVSWATKYHKPQIGGSDAHLAREVGNVVTCAYENSNERFMEAIRKEENRVEGISFHLCERLGEYIRYYPYRTVRSIFEKNK